VVSNLFDLAPIPTDHLFRLAVVGISLLLSFYSARKTLTLVDKVANAGGAHMILVVFTVCLLLSA
jgi:hypothetical protein